MKKSICITALPAMLLLASCAPYNTKCIVYNRSSSEVAVELAERFKTRHRFSTLLLKHRPPKHYFRAEVLAIHPGDSLRIGDVYPTSDIGDKGYIRKIIVAKSGEVLENVEGAFFNRYSIVTVKDHSHSQVLSLRRR